MNLNNLTSEIKSVFLDWAPDVVNLLGMRIDNCLSWPNRKIAKSNKPVTRADVLMMDLENQYSMQIAEDGALIRLYYAFDASKQRLLSASLGYYATQPALVSEGEIEGVFLLEEEKAGILPEPDMMGESVPSAQPTDSPIDEHAVESAGIVPEEVLPAEVLPNAPPIEFFGVLPDIEEAEFAQETAPEVAPDDAVVSWIRFDYDPSAKETGILHHDCHLHLAGFPHMRIPVTAVPSPAQFVDFVMATCYPGIYKEHRLADPHSFTDPNHYERIGSACVRLDNFEWLGGVTSLWVPLGAADARARAIAQKRAEEERKKAGKTKKKGR